MTKNINEAQLKNIISECVKSVLKEHYNDFNDGARMYQSENPKLRSKSLKAGFSSVGVPGKNDTGVEAFEKRSGGSKKIPTDLFVLYNRAIEGQEGTEAQFFKAMRNNKEISDKVNDLLMHYNHGFQRYMNDAKAGE